MEGFNMGDVSDWKDELQPAVESDEKGFFVEPGGEGDVEKAEAPDPETMPIEELKKIRLQRKRTVLQLQGPSGDDKVYFADVDEETQKNNIEYHMLYQDWVALGEPPVITVGVVNGDIFN